jgi:predicted permease
MPQILELSAIFVNILLPVFCLVGVGAAAGPRLQLEARTLSKLSYYVLVPAFIFDIFSRAEIDPALALRMAGFIVAVTLVGVTVSYVLARLLGAGPELVAAYILVAAFGNVGNFGLPVIRFKLGDEALVAASVYFLIANTFGFIVGVMAATWRKDSSRWRAVWAAFTTPGVIAVLPAFLVNWLGIPVHLFVERSIGLMAEALIPVMLLTLGIQLAAMGRPRIGRHVVAVSAVRLLVGPLVAALLATLFGLTGIARDAGIIQASMPAAVLTTLIALEHDLLPDFITTVVLFSTLASAVTLTLVLGLL